MASDLGIIWLDVEDGDAVVTVRGGEEDLGPLGTPPRVLLRSTVMDGSVLGVAQVRCTTVRQKQDKIDNVNLKWESNSICNR